MTETVNQRRRRMLAATAMTIAAVDFPRAGAADAPSAGAMSSLAPLKQVNAGLLNVGYAEAGPASGPPVILLHGWPYDICSFVDVAPLLASAGYRVIVPYVRGYGTTRFLSPDAFRNGQPSALAADVPALMDALNAASTSGRSSYPSEAEKPRVCVRASNETFRC